MTDDVVSRTDEPTGTPPGVRPDAVARMLLLALLLLNYLLTALGLNPVPVSEDEFYVVVTAGLTFVWGLWAAWKNNSFTRAARAADELLLTLKKRGKV